MPEVGKKKFAYTTAGKDAAKRARAKLKKNKKKKKGPRPKMGY